MWLCVDDGESKLGEWIVSRIRRGARLLEASKLVECEDGCVDGSCGALVGCGREDWLSEETSRG